MPSSNISTAAAAGSVGFNSSYSMEDSGVIAIDPALAAAKAGTLTTRTDADTGEVTCEAGHGFAQFDVVDVYWDGGRIYGMDVGVVVGNVVPIDSGTGDALPDATTAITMQVQEAINVDFIGNDMSLLLALCAQKGIITLSSAVPAVVLVIDLVANKLQMWEEDSMHTNPLAGATVASGTVSQGSVTATTMKLGILYDSTP